MSQHDQPDQDASLRAETAPRGDELPRYEPPRLARKRSVARVTLASGAIFNGAGPAGGGLVGNG